MKKVLLFALYALCFSSLSAQVTLTQETHGFFSDLKNPMVLTNYVEPGEAGENVVWDFSNLEIKNAFTGNLSGFYSSKCCSKFTKGNVVLEEFGNFFIFESTKDGLEQVGYMSATGNTRFIYTKPFVKMRYPFTFGDSYSGIFEGDYILNDKIIGSISGTYNVEGDGLGKLILPNGKCLDNTLRVKEVRNTKQLFGNSSVLITDITYRWYVPNHRFPVLVLISSEARGQNSKPSLNTRAAYNTNVMNATTSTPLNPHSNINLSIYPNPYIERVNIDFSISTRSDVKINIYDLTGRFVKELENSTLDAGPKHYEFSAKSMGLPSGAYILKLNSGNLEVTRKLIEL